MPFPVPPDGHGFWGPHSRIASDRTGVCLSLPPYIGIPARAPAASPWTGTGAGRRGRQTDSGAGSPARYSVSVPPCLSVADYPSGNRPSHCPSGSQSVALPDALPWGVLCSGRHTASGRHGPVLLSACGPGHGSPVARCHIWCRAVRMVLLQFRQ